MKNPVVGIWGNILLFLMHNFAPPFFPQATWWNQNILLILPKAISGPMQSNFEQGFQNLWEIPTEDWVGLGFGLSVLLLISCLSRPRPLTPAPTRTLVLPPLVRRLALVTPWLSLLAFCVKSGMVTGARLIAPHRPPAPLKQGQISNNRKNDGARMVRAVG